MILGGLVAVALFAALIGPYFINWNDYKGTFEAEAEKILGQPVRVVGTASATLLPLPSLTFTQVQVGETEGAPMMTVEHFDVTIELMPLLEGEIRVVSMKLGKPHVKISVDDSGTVDWLLRTEASKALNPEKVVLEDAEIVECPQGQSGDADAGAIGAPLRIGVGKLYLDTPPGQRQRRAHPTDATADHQGLADHRSPPAPALRPGLATSPCRGSFRRAGRCR